MSAHARPAAPRDKSRRMAEQNIMRYDFLIESYATERVKVLSVWSEFRDGDLPIRPQQDDHRGRDDLVDRLAQCADFVVRLHGVTAWRLSKQPLEFSRAFALSFVLLYWGRALVLTAQHVNLRLFTLQTAAVPWETWLLVPLCWLLLLERGH
jgi:hypothetical protein